MPTYQYRCKECGHDLEVVQSFTDDPLETCPECEGSLKKVYGNVGISFKGSGFYKTDSRGSKKKTIPSSTSADSAGSSGSKDSDSKKSDSSTTTDKPASKPTTPAAKSD